MTIGEVDEVVEIELVNYFITGNIALTKVDKDYPDNKLTVRYLRFTLIQRRRKTG